MNDVSLSFYRDLSGVRAEVSKSVRVVQGACMELDKNLRGMDANTQAALEEERNQRQMVKILYSNAAYVADYGNTVDIVTKQEKKNSEVLRKGRRLQSYFSDSGVSACEARQRSTIGKENW